MSKLAFVVIDENMRYEFFDDGVCRWFEASKYNNFTNSRGEVVWRYAVSDNTLKWKVTYDGYVGVNNHWKTFLDDSYIDAYQRYVGKLVVEDLDRAR